MRPQWRIKRPSDSGNRFKPGASGRSRVCTSTTLAGRMALEAERHLPTYLQRDRVDRPGHLGREQHRQPDYATNPNGGLAASGDGRELQVAGSPAVVRKLRMPVRTGAGQVDESHGANVRGGLIYLRRTGTSTVCARSRAGCVWFARVAPEPGRNQSKRSTAASGYVAKSIVCCLTPPPARAAQPPSAFVE